MWNPNQSANESRKNVSISDENKILTDNKKQAEVIISTKSEEENQSRGVDSGFLSGLHDSESCELEEDIVEGLQTKKQTAGKSTGYEDSGCLDDIEAVSEKKIEGSHMILDSGVDSGLTEWFCNLSLKNSNQPLNNLGSTISNSKKSSDFNILNSNSCQSKNNRNKQIWEAYYQQNNDGDTQLHLACITGYFDVVSALIRLSPHPCLLDIQNDDAQSAIHLAVLAAQPKIVRLLLVAGAEATVRDRNGNTPLHLACISGDLECVKALTIPISASEIQEATLINIIKCETSTYHSCAQLPPDLEQRNYDGERCVHLAAQGSHTDVLRHLVRFGADVNAREGKSGRTPLHIAMEMCNEMLANFLLEECQELNIETTTYAGLTAYQFAVISQNQEMKSDLERRGAELLTPPDSDVDSDVDSDFEDSQMYDRFGDPGFFVSPYNGNNPINVA